MPVLSVALPDFADLNWSPPFARLPDFLRTQVGAYLLSVRNDPGSAAYYVERIEGGRVRTLGKGETPDLYGAKCAAYDYAIAHARATVAAIGGEG